MSRSELKFLFAPMELVNPLKGTLQLTSTLLTGSLILKVPLCNTYLTCSVSTHHNDRLLRRLVAI